jgi:hypothetical protein
MVINFHGISVIHNIDIVSIIFGILSNFGKPNLKVFSHDIRIEPIAFEYHWLQRTATLEFELVYLFDYAVIVLLIIAGRTNSAARGFLLGPALLVASSAKAIAIDIISGE